MTSFLISTPAAAHTGTPASPCSLRCCYANEVAPAPGAGCRSRSAPAPNRQEAIFFGRPFSSIRFKRWDAFDETVAADSLDRAIKQPSDLLIGLGPEELFLLAGPAAAGGGKTQ